MSSPMMENSLHIEIETNRPTWAMAFASNGDYLVTGGTDDVRLRRMKDGTEMTSIKVGLVLCLTISKDDRWIAAGVYLGSVLVWDAQTYERVFLHREFGEDIDTMTVDFSPDSTRLVIASNGMAKPCSVWDIATRQRVLGPLLHENYVKEVKYSPQGDRIATATKNFVRVYDSNDGRLLIDIPVGVVTHNSKSLLWLNDQLFILSDNKIMRVDASTGSAVAEWPVPDFYCFSCIALPRNGELIACSTRRTIIFWDTSTHSQLGLIQHPADGISSMALSFDGRILAIGADKKITIHNLSRATVDMANGPWSDALRDVDEAIAQDPSSPWGYEAKHEVLYGARRYADAVDAFEEMLSKMVQSPNPKIRDRRVQYISPSVTRAEIRRIVQRTIRRLPRMLINASTGRLESRAEQASTFESSPVFHELLSSMTMRIDRGRIKREVKQFFRYVMLSHKWEDNEPLFQRVIHVAVYDLDKSPTHDKLQAFCKIVRDAGFNWAWSDICCIDKQDHFVLQQALVAMFKWYRGSALVIVYLRGVRSPGMLGDLVKSTWNTRAWTFQEYIAGKVVHFYTEDWKLYLDLEIPNHKESPEIILEMEQVTGISAERLVALHPGLDNIREKLCLASTRKTTLVEDAAYSLLGIFSVTGIPAIYGEGESALGRLLAHILSGSGDVSILAWTGQSSAVNSCLPAHITVYNLPVTSHLPHCIEVTDMENTLTTLRDSTLDFDQAVRLYDRVNELPTAWFAASRMKLPCIAFQLPSFSLHRTHLGRVYRAETVAFGVVEIKTRRDLSRLKSLYLIHPWMDALLGRENTHVGAFIEDDVAEPPSPGADSEGTDVEDAEDDFSPILEPELPSSHRPVDIVPLDKQTRALQLVGRLRQPFGALLFMLASTNGREEYRRVVADKLITAQIQESVPLEELLENVRILDVL